MPRHISPAAKPVSTDQVALDAELFQTSALAALPPEQVQRWVELIAEGRDLFPADLSATDRDLLVAETRRRLRDRLVRHIACAIALDLRSAGKSQEEQ
jgi:hypothetical protein